LSSVVIKIWKIKCKRTAYSVKAEILLMKRWDKVHGRVDSGRNYKLQVTNCKIKETEEQTLLNDGALVVLNTSTLIQVIIGFPIGNL
jgi:hypothetical protein